MSDEAQYRKDTPVWSGFVNYFPRAMQEVARLSKVGNDQHNPGTELHWDRAKSGDEKDACMRHLIDAGTIDTDGVRHSTKTAWRAMANLEKELEQADAVALFLKRSEERSARDTVTLGDVLDNRERSAEEFKPQLNTKGPRQEYFKAMAKSETRGQLARRIENQSRLIGQHKDEIAGYLQEFKGVEGCAKCHRLQNDLDRHECRVLTPVVFPTQARFQRYLNQFDQVAHFKRWDAIDHLKENK
jgi:rubrerythrin